MNLTDILLFGKTIAGGGFGGGGLPKVTLSTIATVDAPGLSAEESAAMDAAMKNGMFILECPVLIEGFTIIFRGIPYITWNAEDASSIICELRLFFGDGDIIVQVCGDRGGDGNFEWYVFTKFVDTSAT